MEEGMEVEEAAEHVRSGQKRGAEAATTGGEVVKKTKPTPPQPTSKDVDQTLCRRVIRPSFVHIKAAKFNSMLVNVRWQELDAFIDVMYATIAARLNNVPAAAIMPQTVFRRCCRMLFVGRVNHVTGKEFGARRSLNAKLPGKMKVPRCYADVLAQYGKTTIMSDTIMVTPAIVGSPEEEREVTATSDELNRFVTFCRLLDTAGIVQLKEISMSEQGTRAWLCGFPVPMTMATDVTVVQMDFDGAEFSDAQYAAIICPEARAAMPVAYKYTQFSAISGLVEMRRLFILDGKTPET